ncbi:MAG: hypothetical protein AMXMBFR66_05860 [Pseudomonadota bacterium]|nr:methyltransferase domain-containing protein [Rubrivivax sp.]NLZ42258.1 class I SAM-dependent methyltransferase [Comamonadaceae bacterium]
MTTRHLDLGCGRVPRNPYGRDELYGVDLDAPADGEGRIRRANLAVAPIPWPDDSFESVSAYDFLEHVPRVLPTADGQGTRFPFIELMNEIWRVLVPGGLFYASTPAYPHKTAFQDPTHVNYVTADTHEYFTRPKRLAALYGFSGDFEARRVQLTKSSASHDFVPVPANWFERARLARRIRQGRCSHVIWEFVALEARAR